MIKVKRQVTIDVERYGRLQALSAATHVPIAEYIRQGIQLALGAADRGEGPLADEPWIQTYTGLAFTPLRPLPSQIALQDIAHSLSMQVRFTGHLGQFYSVAEHSVRVADVVALFAEEDPEAQLWALLHDASEAYLCDLPAPIKHDRLLAGYRRLEARVQRAVCARFGLPADPPPLIKYADKVLLATEQRDLLVPSPRTWRSTERQRALTDEIHPWTQPEAKRRFLDRYHQLERSRGQ